MNNISKGLEQTILGLHQYCASQGYKGYSLYDSHNSVIPFEKFGHKISFLTNQVVKRSPVNLRGILGVKKGINPKGVGLFLHSYSLLHNSDLLPKETTLELMHEKFNWLKENYSKGYSGYCWGYNYDWPRSDGSMFHSYTPSVVVTAFIARGLIEYYKITNEPVVKSMIKSACEFVKNDVHCSMTDQGRCYSYTPVQRDMVINANLLAAEILAYDDMLSESRQYLPIIKEVLDFTLAHQNEDGSWYYSVSVKDGKPKKQIDFHQGYVVDSIQILKDIYDLQDEKYTKSIELGTQFYFKDQFSPDGYCYWRIPKVWPIDIHNQSQGIITFTRFSDDNAEYLPFASKIFEWTDKNMKAKSGRFYYQKYSWFTNKTDYLRWNQGWMLLAATTLYTKLQQVN